MEGKTIHLFGYFEVNSRKNRAIGRWFPFHFLHGLRYLGLMKAIYVLLLLCCVCTQSDGQPSDTLQARYRHQYQLIDSLRSFISHDLQLYVPEDFYYDWQETGSDSMYTFLYVSFADHVAKDTALHINSYFASESQARSAAADLTERGYHTMIYKTAGMSSTVLNRKLLSYPDEAIAFILFHEVIHRNMVHLGHPIAYRFEESFADAVANYACVRFARYTHLLDTTATCRQRDVFEKAYQYVNAQRKILDRKSVAARRKIYIRCTTVIPQITQPGNQFQKDRMNYPVNNAYFLRMQDYASHYFTIRQMIGDNFELHRMIAQIKDIQ